MFTHILYWLSQRLHDAAQWPINLLRDLPLRLQRLAATLTLDPDTVRHKQPRLFRLHRLLAELFDLVGGPEICQFLMHLTTHTTPLTSQEIAVISSVLGDNALRFEDVRVAEGGLLDLIFKHNGNLAFATWRTINLPRTGQHTRANLSLVVHELTHVFQYETVGSRYLGEALYMLITTQRDCYRYGSCHGLANAHTAGKQYCEYNREQQAQIVQDFFTLRERGEDVSAYQPFMAQARAKQL